MRIYSQATVLLLELKNTVSVDSGAEIRDVTHDNVDDALAFQHRRQVQVFRSFLKRGDKGYYAYLNGKCIHRSWVVLTPQSVLLHKFYKIPLKKDEVFIQYCETDPSVRGKNIFTHVLSVIGKDHSDKRVLTSVDATNLSSLKSMTKAGFFEVVRISIKVVLGIKKISMTPNTELQ